MLDVTIILVGRDDARVDHAGICRPPHHPARPRPSPVRPPLPSPSARPPRRSAEGRGPSLSSPHTRSSLRSSSSTRQWVGVLPTPTPDAADADAAADDDLVDGAIEVRLAGRGQRRGAGREFSGWTSEPADQLELLGAQPARVAEYLGE